MLTIIAISVKILQEYCRREVYGSAGGLYGRNQKNGILTRRDWGLTTAKTEDFDFCTVNPTVRIREMGFLPVVSGRVNKSYGKKQENQITARSETISCGRNPGNRIIVRSRRLSHAGPGSGSPEKRRRTSGISERLSAKASHPPAPCRRKFSFNRIRDFRSPGRCGRSLSGKTAYPPPARSPQWLPGPPGGRKR